MVLELVIIRKVDGISESESSRTDGSVNETDGRKTGCERKFKEMGSDEVG